MSQRLELRAEDGVRLSALLDRPSAQASMGTAGILLLPGLWRRAESARMRDLALELARRWPVITLDFRGHGKSSGTFTFGQLEHLDVEAALRAAREQGIERVALVGMSMGAAAIPAALGGGGALPVEVVSAVLIAAPGDFGAIRPRPWRGRRDVAWADAVHVPRLDWRFPFTRKRRPQDHFATFPDVPVRFLHARNDWLVDHSLGERVLAANPARGEFYLIDTPGLHADELLGRRRDLVLRLLRPFVDASLSVAGAAHPAHVGSAEEATPEVAADAWREALVRHVRDVASHAPDLGGVPLEGDVGELMAFAAGRDGVQIAVRVGDRVATARGLRDGTVHGLNLLANALAADAPAWPRPLRVALTRAQARLGGRAVAGPGATRVVRPRGAAGFEVLEP